MNKYLLLGSLLFVNLSFAEPESATRIPGQYCLQLEKVVTQGGRRQRINETLSLLLDTFQQRYFPVFGENQDHYPIFGNAVLQHKQAQEILRMYVVGGEHNMAMQIFLDLKSMKGSFDQRLFSNQQEDGKADFVTLHGLVTKVARENCSK